jgi:hypothetical protein
MLPTAFGYPVRRVALLACPFCREMFEEGEAKACPVCGMELTKFDKLPPSHDALADEGGVPLAPEVESFAWTYLGRGRGLLVAVGLVGIALFFLPWVHLTSPYIDTRSGFDLAHRIGWLWGALAAWVVLVPTVASRRSIVQLRGARVAAAFLSAIPALSIAILLVLQPHGVRGVPIHYTWGTAMFAAFGLSILAIVASVRLGGRVDDIKVTRGTSKGELLH